MSVFAVLASRVQYTWSLQPSKRENNGCVSPNTRIYAPILGTGEISEAPEASTRAGAQKHSTLDLSPECVVGLLAGGGTTATDRRSFRSYVGCSERRQAGSL
jgi:hypothetical protein